MIFRRSSSLLAGIFSAVPIFAAISSPTAPDQTQVLASPPAAALQQIKDAKALTPHAPAMPVFEAPSTRISFSAQPTDREIMLRRILEVALVSEAGSAQPMENADLAEALMSVSRNPQDALPIAQFLERHPATRWKVSLFANLGYMYFNEGYWSKSLASWELAWKFGKELTEPRLKAISDDAIGELAYMNARLGRVERLEELKVEVKGRDIRGSGTEHYRDSLLGLWTMENRPGDSFRCGPIAVSAVYKAVNPRNAIPEELVHAPSTSKGTDMESLRKLAKDVGLDYQVAFRKPGAQLLLPSIVNWKVGHFSALTREMQGKLLSQDLTFKSDALISRQAVDEEASGYFLVPSGSLPAGWRPVGSDEASMVYGKGEAGSPPHSSPNGTGEGCGGGGCGGGMTTYSFQTATVSLLLADTPVGYKPPIGPEVQFMATYDHREEADDQTTSSLGNKWTFQWLAYIMAPSSAATVSFGPGGGQLAYAGFNSSTGAFAGQILTEDTLLMVSSTDYEMHHPDGSVDIYNLPDGVNNPKIYRTKSIDRLGNALTFAYDSFYRLQTVTDAIGQVTVISYGLTSDPTDLVHFYKITQVTDPFGRQATFTYNALAQLTSITDVLGIVSSFTYGANDFVNTLTTPYGTTTFTDNENGVRALTATDPLGGVEMIQWSVDSAWPGDPVCPTGFSNTYTNYRNVFFWDKKAMADYPGDLTKAVVNHFLHSAADESIMSNVLESKKLAYENRVWYGYQGEALSSHTDGTSNQPTYSARVLDDGTEQDYSFQYNAAGNRIQSVDPVGREQDFDYDANLIDLLHVRVKNGQGYDVVASYTYNGQHQPLTSIDAAGQTTTYTYNTFGEILTIKNPKNEVTTYAYDGNGYLQSITGALPGATTTFAYDTFGRVSTVTDSEGYAVTTTYDAANRPVQIAYPDGTYEQTLYNRLDAEWTSDRLGRWTRKIHDALQHVVVLQDPLLRRTSFDWCTCGNMVGLIDPAGNRTSWVRDAQSRILQKNFPDGTAINYTYENATSRLKILTDAIGQITDYIYNRDNTVAQVVYTNPVNITPNVSYTYDPVYSRIVSMHDGVGTTAYTYFPYSAGGTLGANRVASISGPLANTVTSYTYDELGRVVTSAINGTNNTSSSAYDALGRVTSVTNPLGAFAYAYLDTTSRIKSIVYPSGQTTNYLYYPNSAAMPGNDDQRLSEIQNLGFDGSNLSTFNYSYDAAGKIASLSKSFGSGPILGLNSFYDAADQLIGSASNVGAINGSSFYTYDVTGNRVQSQTDNTITSAKFNSANQLISTGAGTSMAFAGTANKPVSILIGGQPATLTASGAWMGSSPVSVGANSIPLVATDSDSNSTTKTINVQVVSGLSRSLKYDLNGNLLDNGNGQTYQWDAANRLVGIIQSSGTTGFVYDGTGRRTQETLNATVIKQWVWCGSQPCEELDASGAVIKAFFSQGEQIGGTAYFYTRDHLGSIREITDGAGAIHARYDYDPYGTVTKIQADLDADFGFTGDYYHKASGLNLTLYRAYDPVTARWLSRDPLGEYAGTNLYAYVENDPINSFDPLGLDTCTCDRKIGGGPAENRPSSILPTVTHTFTFTKNPNGSIKHTYSWGNKANEHGWNKDQPEDIAAANEAVANGYLQWEGGSALDPFVDQAFNELNVPANEHRNLGVARNCKTESGNLLDRAKADQAAAGK